MIKSTFEARSHYFKNVNPWQLNLENKIEDISDRLKSSETLEDIEQEVAWTDMFLLGKL